jgi:hypothetical protein
MVAIGNQYSRIIGNAQRHGQHARLGAARAAVNFLARAYGISTGTDSAIQVSPYLLDPMAGSKVEGLYNWLSDPFGGGVITIDQGTAEGGSFGAVTNLDVLQVLGIIVHEATHAHEGFSEALAYQAQRDAYKRLYDQGVIDKHTYEYLIQIVNASESAARCLPCIAQPEMHEHQDLMRNTYRNKARSHVQGLWGIEAKRGTARNEAR